MSKRILYVINHAGYFLSHRLPLALAARAEGYDVHIATPGSRHVPRIVEAGLPWHPVRMTRSGRNPIAEARSAIDFVHLYRDVRPDLVHQVTSKPILYGTLAARITNVPAVVNAFPGLGHVFVADDPMHRVLRQAIGWAYRVILRHPRMKIIFQNNDDRLLFVRNRWLRAEQTVLIAGSGVDPDRFRPSEHRLAVGEPVVMFPSRMLRTKGVGEFLEAVAELRHGNVHARFVLVGEPDPDNPASISAAELQRQAASSNVEYWGRREDMPSVLAQADIVCLPSHREGMPKILIEAASAGLPIVTTDVPGCRDVVGHEYNGLLVPVRDAKALAVSLRRLIEAPALRHEMGERGRVRVLEEFSLDRVIAATLSLYRELLA